MATLHVFIGTGQSPNAGAPIEGGSAEPLTTDPPYPEILFCPNGGTMAHQDGAAQASVSIAINPAQYASLVPCREGIEGDINGIKYRETPSTAVGEAFIRGNAISLGDKVCVFNISRGSNKFESIFGSAIAKGRPWLDAEDILQSDALRNFAFIHGLNIQVSGVWTLGHESNADDSESTYGTRLGVGRTRIDGLKAITGQTKPIPWVVGLVNKPDDATGGIPSTSHATLKRAIETDPYLIPHPMYWLDTDTTAPQSHYYDESYRLNGEAIGYLFADWHRQNGLRSFLYLKRARRRSDKKHIVAEWSMAPVSKDGTWVNNPGKAGVSYLVNGVAASVSTVGLEADRSTLRVGLAAIPPADAVETLFIGNTGAKSFGESGWGLGNRIGNRTVFHTKAARFSAMFEAPLHRWAVPQRIAVSIV